MALLQKLITDISVTTTAICGSYVELSVNYYELTDYGSLTSSI